jgi:hypothetical protein
MKSRSLGHLGVADQRDVVLGAPLRVLQRDLAHARPCHGAGNEHGFQCSERVLFVGDPEGIRREPWIGRHVQAVRRVAHPGELEVVPDADVDVAVVDAEGDLRRDRCVTVVV